MMQETSYGELIVDEDIVVGRGLIKPKGICIKEIKFNIKFLINALNILKDEGNEKGTLYVYNEKDAPIIIGERKNDKTINGVIVAPIVEDE